ncbi:MAG: MarC family protein [Nitrospinae bacterium]|nr:MarC family protein [Nitrospinota bacterium]
MTSVAGLFFVNCFVTLFSVLDPFGAAVTFLALTAGDTPAHRRTQAIRALVVTAGVLLLFTVAGSYIFAAFGVSVEALMVSGGVILGLYGFRMLEGEPFIPGPPSVEGKEGMEAPDVSIIPMAIPFLAGPAAITAVIVFATKADGAAAWGALFAAEGLALGLTGAILLNADRLASWMGETGVRIATRLMGVILLAMAAEFALSGVKGY